MTDLAGTPETLRCFVIGENSLLAECTARLLERGHQVLGLISQQPALRDWARQHAVPAHGADADLMSVLGEAPFDYLFSITNLRMLPEKVLRVPERFAINFHDALLPRHAGLFATSWALLDTATGPARHGVTWHVMTASADSGDILVQREVPAEPDDTAYQLNTKCYQAGAESFAELLDVLAADSVVRTPQELGLRTYHARADLLPDAGFLCWAEPAEQLHALVRSTEFGPVSNEFGSAKLWCDGEVLLAGDSALTGLRSDQEPGTVVSAGEHGITVATGSTDITIGRLSTVEGSVLGPAELARRWGIEPGHRLPHLADETRTRVVADCAALRPHEPFWVRRLADPRPLGLPYRDPPAQPAAAWATMEFAVPTDFGRFADEPAVAVLAALLLFLGRIGDADRFDLGLRCQDSFDWLGADRLVADEVLLRAPELAACGDFAGLCASVAAELARVRRRRTYLADVWTRFPALRDSVARNGLPIVVDLGERPAAPRSGSAALVHIPPEGGRCSWLVPIDPTGVDIAACLRADFGDFLAALAAAPEDVLAVPLLAGPRRHQVLHEWNATDAAYPRDHCLTTLFTERARRQPDRPAVIAPDETLTYAELDRRADQLAAYLNGNGIGRGDRVGIYLRRQAALPVTLLGVAKSGAAYVPLDPIYPAERIRYMVEDAALPLVLTQAELAGDLGADASTFLVDRDWHACVAAGTGPRDRAVADDPAYVIYTSGSTGRPKGVQVGHRALTNFLCSMAQRPGCAESDRLLAVTTVCFDIAGLELYLPLITGGQLELVSEAVAADGHALRERMERGRPTVMQATPATWRMLIAAGWAGNPELRVLCGGEALPADLAEDLLARAGAVWNLYGPTETTIWSTVSRVRAGEPVAIGRPIGNTRCYVLDRWGQPTPPLVPGELHLGGDGVADGYVGQPELTARKFVDDPFGGRGRLYRTGDLARYLPDGRLEYLNRIDNQVKLRGFRIELGEIEATLRRHPDVAQAVALVREDRPGDVRLVAYLVPAVTSVPATAALRAHLARELPDYMVPAAFVPVTRIPLTPNGKLDRAALPAPAGRTDPPAGPPPAGRRELAIASVWRAVLRVDRIGVDDNFFDLGGNSLLLSSVVERLRTELGVALTTLDMFRCPTVRTMTEWLGTDRSEEPSVVGQGSGRRLDRGAILERRRLRRG